MSSVNKKNSSSDNSKSQEIVSVVYEEIGLFPRSFSRVLDRFLKQVFSDVENLVIQEYRFYRYLFLTTLKCLFILFFVPFFVNFLAKTYVVRPLTEYFWNTKQPEIFLNSYQQKHAFAELKDFEEKLYFESLIYPKTASFVPEGERAISSASAKPSLSLRDSQTVEAKKTNEDEVKTQEIPLKNNSAIQESQNPYKNIIAVNKSVSSPSVKPLLSISEFNNVLNNESLGANDPLRFEDSGGGLFAGFTFGEEKEVASPSSPSVKKVTDKTAKPRIPFNSLGGSFAATEEKTESLINAYTLKSSLFVYQTIEADKNIQQRYQEKTIELAQRYNDQSIEAITNFFADLISLFTLFYLLYALEIQINITKSFLLEVFFGLDDSKKSLLILLVTDLLVGYHSSNLWELFFEFLFHHYGLPESQTGIFLLVATLPVLLDVLFKYLIFRHLNRSSPATVATYHAMIE